MLKSALISINVIGLVLFPFLYAENVSIDHAIPSSINAGEEIYVQLTLNKGNVSGPARLKLDFSSAQGLDAAELESAGASFTYKDNSVLFIWYSIPADETINLKYKLSAKSDATGPQTVSGTFSYVDGGERKKLVIPSAIIEVQGGAVATNDPDADTTGTGIVFIDSGEPINDTA
ncbi:MAG: hypothetical protein ACI9J3_000324, partial [Parvicellaceae bacterium]